MDVHELNEDVAVDVPDPCNIQKMENSIDVSVDQVPIVGPGTVTFMNCQTDGDVIA